MKAVYQVRLHGRGGQGVVTAAELIASAAIADGLYAQAFPSFGSERTGAPVAAYCRIDDKPIRSREPVADPDAILVLDATLLSQDFVFDGLRPGGTALINSSAPVTTAALTLCGVRALVLPATEIARERIGRPLCNAAMVGAFAATGVLSLAAVRDAITSRFPGRLAETNCAAAVDAFMYVQRGGVTPAALEDREAESVQ